jgi:hypothetical protein
VNLSLVNAAVCVCGVCRDGSIWSRSGQGSGLF